MVFFVSLSRTKIEFVKTKYRLSDELSFIESFIIDTSRVQYAVRTQHFSHFRNKIKESPLYLSLVHPEKGYCWSSNRHDKIRREVLAQRRARS